jgi:hypothetical protein
MAKKMLLCALSICLLLFLVASVQAGEFSVVQTGSIKDKLSPNSDQLVPPPSIDKVTIKNKAPLAINSNSVILERWVLVKRVWGRLFFTGDSVTSPRYTASSTGTTRFRMTGPVGTDFDLYVNYNGRWYSRLTWTSDELFTLYMVRGRSYYIYVESDGGSGNAEIAVHRWV